MKKFLVILAALLLFSCSDEATAENPRHSVDNTDNDDTSAVPRDSLVPATDSLPR